MKIKIKKFGGSSLVGNMHFQNVAEIIKNDIENGFAVVVVVSAAFGYTDLLNNQITQITKNPEKREVDVILSAGEQINAGLMSVMLNAFGIKAVSFLGWQLPIKTNSKFCDADIIDININKIILSISYGIVPVIAGFQGVNEDMSITTLGRGGSDMTAVMLASFLNAHKCDIYTDVDAVYTADPKIVSGAKKIYHLDHISMYEASLLGSKIMHHKAVAAAIKTNTEIEVLSSFVKNTGTILTKKQHQSNHQTIFCSRKINEAFLFNDDYNFYNISELSIGICLENTGHRLVYRGLPYQEKNNHLSNDAIMQYSNLSEVSIVGTNIDINIMCIISFIESKGIKIIAFCKRQHSISIITTNENERLLTIALHKEYNKKNEEIF